MIVNVSLEGYTESVVDNAIKNGVVKTKAEAIRFALLLFGREYNFWDTVTLDEVKKVRKKTEQEMKQIKASGEKLYTLAEIRKEFKV
ncbi:MAG: hypothetical protein COT14_02305 [Candidatus Diapherotrites archaeon CG08_land_8_20_14_0_20_30_16]|nr:MAG: hypothetical protein COT14_02305 [Candidatus Diapherotrites archaeon CG08_land_8_20_14_0_20_30_16]